MQAGVIDIEAELADQIVALDDIMHLLILVLPELYQLQTVSLHVRVDEIHEALLRQRG
ncbi:hypothetical protein D3C71_1889720 [compost metagenome]